MTKLRLQTYNYDMSSLTLFHGSKQIIQKPEYGKGKTWNDYGQGFYCTEVQDLAKEWACPDQSDGFVNFYKLDISNLKILNLNSPDFTTLHWLTLLVCNRIFDIDTQIMQQAVSYLKANFSIPIEAFDIIRGYRADDSYFSFARAFLSNQISYSQLQRAMKLGELGEQIVIKSQKAFSRLEFINFETAEHNTWYQKRRLREDKAKSDFYSMQSHNDLFGLFIRDIILQEIKADDSRLQ